MKKAKSLFFSIVFLSIFLMPLAFIQNKFTLVKVSAAELTKTILKAKRDSYFSGFNFTFPEDRTVKILIVPGHDDVNFGTEYKGTREVELNRELSAKIYDLLSREPGFEVTLASSERGYNSIIQKYFDKNKTDIDKFIVSSKEEFQKKVKDGDIDLEQQVYHNSAPADAAFKLYGINKWVNENKYDFVIHIHFNDYGGRYRDKNPKYSGFSIYIPDSQFRNHELSKNLANDIFSELSKLNPPSDNKVEKGGVIEDNQLIAVGAHETLDAASVLIEYGYIYEPHFTDPGISDLVLNDLAKQTYIGVKDFFGEKPLLLNEKYIFKNDLTLNKKKRTKDNYMLQKELALNGFYPPNGKSLNECPIAGLFGSCTEVAIKNFQKSKGLPPTGYVGEKTRKILNSI